MISRSRFHEHSDDRQIRRCVTGGVLMESHYRSSVIAISWLCVYPQYLENDDPRA